MSRRVIVLWADRTSSNLGVRVLAEGAGELSRRVWGETTEVVYQDFAGRETGVSVGPRACLAELNPFGHSPISRLVSGFDLVLDTGAGDSFTDIYGLKRFFNVIAVQTILLRQGVPMLMTPQTIGPFRGGVSRIAASRILRRVDVLATRDSVSAGLSADLGRIPDHVSSDLAFLLQREPRGGGEQVLVNVSGLLWKPNPHVDHTAYRRNVLATIASIVQRGLKCALLPHVLDNPSDDNDVRVLEDVKSAFGSDIRTCIPTDLKSARRMIADSRLVVASRMHASLNALSLGVPAISLAYSRKFVPLMADIGWQEVYRADDPCVPDAIASRLEGRETERLTRMAGDVEAEGRRRSQELVAALRAGTETR